MRIFEVPRSATNTLEVELPRADMVIDPRVLELDHDGWKFDCFVREGTLTLIRTDKNQGWDKPLNFRLYDPEEEEVPDFNNKSRIYIYHGLDGEFAPCDSTEVIVHPSVKKIKESAFCGCKNIKKCVMEDGVITIGQGAFAFCESMKVIRLSRMLRYISGEAFESCTSMDAFFLPFTVEEIEGGAFRDCTSMRILLLPPSIDLERVGHRIVHGCPSLLTGSVQYWYADEDHDEMVNHWVKHRLDSLPLHKICMDATITPYMITEFVQEHGTNATFQRDEHGLTPLHLLTINPYANLHTIMACYDANPHVTICHDNRGFTPIDYLWEYDDMEGILSLIQALCIRRETYQHLESDSRKRKRRWKCRLLKNEVISYI